MIYFLDRRPRAPRNALSSAAVDHIVMTALIGCHRIDDGLDAVDLFLVYLVGMFLEASEWANAREHPHQALNGSHLAHLPELIAKIFERKAIARQSARGDVLRLFLVDRLLGSLNERENVGRAENTWHDAIGMGRLKCIVLFTHADELDGRACDLTD